MALFFVNGPMKFKNANNGLTTKIWNPTSCVRLRTSRETCHFWLVRFDPIFFWSSLNVAATKKNWKDFFPHRVGMKQNFYLLSFTTHRLSHCVTGNYLLKVTCQWSQQFSPWLNFIQNDKQLSTGKHTQTQFKKFVCLNAQLCEEAPRPSIHSVGFCFPVLSLGLTDPYWGLICQYILYDFVCEVAASWQQKN